MNTFLNTYEGRFWKNAFLRYLLFEKVKTLFDGCFLKKTLLEVTFKATLLKRNF